MTSNSLSGSKNQHLFVLKLWREGDLAPWRLALRDSVGGAAVGFADLDELLVFLLQTMQQSPASEACGQDEGV
jgi:hypothetical protein